MRARTFLAAGFVAALAAAGLTVVAAPAAYATDYSPAASITDGNVGSLRDVLENQVVDGDLVNLDAGATYTLDECEAGDIDVDAAVRIVGNGATIEQTCPGERVIETEFDITLVSVTITGGSSDSEGGGIRSDAEDGGSVTIVDSTVTGNTTCDEGGGLEVETNDAQVVIVRSTFSNNTAYEESAIDMDEGGDLLVVNSTVSGNTSTVHGAIYGEDDPGSIQLVYSTVVGNIVADGGESCSEAAADADDESVTPAADGQAANVVLDIGNFELVSFGSVIANPVNGPNCSTRDGEPLTSSETDTLGYNYSDDDSCALFAETDKWDAPDPQLGPLGSNGGPTLTHLPLTGSPLIDGIPTVACSDGDELAGAVITTDQRGLVRPDVVNQKCDIGSVEVQTEAPVEIQPNFTG